MKWTRNILILFSLLTIAVVEISAQTASAAAQVVTFGVQRRVGQASRSSDVVNTMSRTPLKITVGSESRFQEAAEIPASTSEKIFLARESAMNAAVSVRRSVNALIQSNFNTTQSVAAKADLSSKPSITITE